MRFETVALGDSCFYGRYINSFYVCMYTNYRDDNILALRHLAGRVVDVTCVPISATRRHTGPAVTSRSLEWTRCQTCSAGEKLHAAFGWSGAGPALCRFGRKQQSRDPMT